MHVDRVTVAWALNNVLTVADRFFSNDYNTFIL